MPSLGMKIENLTVGQFQEIWKIAKSDMDQEDKMTEMVAVLSGKSPNEVDKMLVPEFNALAFSVKEMLSNPIPEVKPKPVINGVGITYEPGKLDRGQYITLMHFLKGDVVENCHLILSSISYNPKTGKHESDKHAEIAELLQDAPIVDVYSSCVFFCDLFKTSMRVFQASLVTELIKTGVQMTEARRIAEDFMTAMDGCIMPSGLLSSKVSAYGIASKGM